MEKALLPWIQPDDRFFSPQNIEMIPQNYVADWFNADLQYAKWIEKVGEVDKQIKLCCEIRKPCEQRLNIYFMLKRSDLTRRDWEAQYCRTLAATRGFCLFSDNGPVPGELNRAFEQNYVTFYSVPISGPEALALTKLKKITSLFTNRLKVDFGSEGECEYMMVVGSAALLVSYEKNILNAKFMVQRASTRRSHIFDWEEGE